MRQQFNVRLPDYTRRQLDRLMTATGMTATEIIILAIERMYRKEETMSNQDGFKDYNELRRALPTLPDDEEVWQLDSAAYVVGSAEQVAEHHGDNAHFVGTVAELRRAEAERE